MSDDRFDEDLKEVILAGVPQSAPPGLRDRVAAVSTSEESHRKEHRPLTLLRLSEMVGAVLAVVLVAGGLTIALRPNAVPVPSATATGSPRTTATASPSATADPLRYADGIPNTWQGEPVLRGQAALDAAKAATDATPFLVAFWAGIEVSHGCTAQSQLANANFFCGYMLNVGDEPGVYSSDLGHALHVDTSKVAPGPVIARVHTHAPALEGCTPESLVAACRAIMIGDAILWNGDEATAPHPTTVALAAAAFRVPASPVSRTMCGGDFLPGVPILVFSSGSGDGSEGVVGIFPSAAALAAVAPEAAANGESDVPVANSESCGYVRWLARGNVLVALGPNAIIGEARAKLQSLPAN
jgi:hypothetical protein